MSLRWLPAIAGAMLLQNGLTSQARADYTLQVQKNEVRGTWEGWGTSMAWWAHVVGGKKYQDVYADLFFSEKTVPFAGSQLPGLGMNILRYNVGGGGRGDTVEGLTEKVPDILRWHRDIDGFWINPANRDPNSPSWDWNRDAGQRAFLKAAMARGVNTVEFFSNAPMWWMNDSQSSAGGNLKNDQIRNFAYYLATVTKQAQDKWGVKVNSVQPFNEPTAGWWNYPKNQEGTNVPREQQKEVLAALRDELNKQNLQAVHITASDENSMSAALTTHEYFKTQTVNVGGQTRPVTDIIDRVNVHSYNNGTAHWRDNAAREKLRQSVGSKGLWASELGGNDATGMALAQTMMEDINFLRPSAWVYWQVLEPRGPWGLVNGTFAATPEDPESGAPTRVFTQYYAMAQFTRFLRPGAQLLGSTDANSAVSYDAKKRQLNIITVNYATPQRIEYDFSGLTRLGTSATLTQTNSDGSKLFETSKIALTGKKLALDATAKTIYSLSIENVDL
jgi:galactan endo-1,6-beta-galactosidase